VGAGRARLGREGGLGVRGVLVAFALAASAVASAQQPDDLKPYPAPDAGTQRIVIRLPAVAAPDDLRVELIPGKTIEVDCNRHAFGAELQRKTAQGWGYPYYVIGDVKGPVATRMACPPNRPKQPAFVQAALRSPSGQIDVGWVRYNARLPIVVYVPDGVELRYRVWRGDRNVGTGTAE
jgi:ecotin